MMQRSLFLVLLAGLCLANVAFAQQNPDSQGLVLVHGFTLHRDSLTPAAYVTVANTRSRMGTISGDNGFFAIRIRRGDTLEFTAINLEKSVYVLPKYYPSGTVSVRAVMRQKVYQLNEITIRPYSQKQFTKDLLGLRLPDDDPDLQLPKIPRLATVSDVARSGGVGVGVSGPITKLYDRFSKEGKSKRKLTAIMANDNRQRVYKAKMNPGFVAKVTGLQTEELEKFMAYCKLAEDFVVESDEYTLASAIQDCLKNFRAGRN